MHGGDRVAEILKAQGVRCVFTLCGGHVSPILTGARARGIRVIDTRHEATAVFAADAVARISGTPGVAVVTAGPGLTNSVTAVKNAQLAQSPLIIIGGATATVLKGRGALQDIDQVALMEPHVKQVLVVDRIRELVPNLERAFAIAKSGRARAGIYRVPRRPALSGGCGQRLVRRGQSWRWSCRPRPAFLSAASSGADV